MSLFLEVAGFVVGVLTLGVAVYAAVEARWARQSSQRGENASDRRWLASTRPRPRVGFNPAQPPLPGAAAVSIVAYNPGGAIPSGLVVARVREKLYIGGLILPAQSPKVISTLLAIAEECPAKYWTGNMVSEMVAVYAEDAEGRFWECENGVRVSEAMPGDVGSEAFFAWLEKVRALGQGDKRVGEHATAWRRIVERIRVRLHRPTGSNP